MDKRSLARSSPAGLAWWHSGAKYTDDKSEWLWLPAPHLLLLSKKIVDVATGRCPRLIVTMPPRHGKSELISKFAPAWFLGNFPNKKVMLASYADTFAAQWGRRARDVLQEEEDLFGIKLNKETSGGQSWELASPHVGIMVTAGVGGGLTGKGAHLLVIDDPVKNAEDAHSETIRDKQWDWWLSTARTRLQSGGGAILVMTRWHEDDLAGRFIANDPRRAKDGTLLPADAPDRTDVEGDHWEVLNLPAFATSDTVDPTTNLDAIGRAPGDVLWPDMFNKEWMNQTKRASGPYWFSAMYQQEPSPAEGMLFKKEHFRYFDRHYTGETWLVTLYKDNGPHVVDLAYCRKFQTVDVAASEDQQADYTVVSTWIVTPDGDMLWWDMEAQQFDTAAVKGFIRRKYWEHTPLVLGIERLGAGLNAIQELGKEGLPIKRLEPDKDKVSRALPVCARYAELRVYHPTKTTASWVDDAEQQMLMFPNGKNDDVVDTVSYAGIELPTFIGGNMHFRTGSRPRHSPSDVVERRPRRSRKPPVTGGLWDRDV